MEPKKRKFREEEEDRRVWDRESGLTAVQNSRAEIEAGAREKKTKVGGFNRWMGYADDNTTSVKLLEEKIPTYAKNEAESSHNDSKGSENDSNAYIQALDRVVKHIQQPRKFLKASEILRRILDELKSKNASSNELFERVFWAMRASMKDPEIFLDHANALEYSRLFLSATDYFKNLSVNEKMELDAYEVWGVIRTTMISTDDSFEFSRSLSQLRHKIECLPDFDESTTNQESKNKNIDPELQDSLESRKFQKSNDAARTENIGEGLQELDEIREEPGNMVFNEAKCYALQRSAVFDCILSTKLIYKRAWARSAIELLIEDVLQKYGKKFDRSQNQVITKLRVWVQEQKVSLHKGLMSSKKTGSGPSSFERAQGAWEKSKAVSSRGSVGTGDRKSGVWLG